MIRDSVCVLVCVHADVQSRRNGQELSVVSFGVYVLARTLTWIVSILFQMETLRRDLWTKEQQLQVTREQVLQYIHSSHF